MESADDDTTMLEQLEREIARWSQVLSTMSTDDNQRRIIEAKLADWKQKRERLVPLFIAELRHNKKSRLHRERKFNGEIN
jgi:hypothetical protein